MPWQEERSEKAARLFNKRGRSDVLEVDVPSAKRVCVVFTRPDRDINKLDVRLGPCVPAPGRKKPLVGRLSQQSLSDDQVDGLFRVLVSDPDASPWASSRVAGNGKLLTFSPEFTEALAEENRAIIERAAQVRVKSRPLTDAQARWVIEPGLEVAAQWLRQSKWPREATVEGVHSNFVAWGGWARAAMERGQRLYCWFGPGVPLKTMRFQRTSGDHERLVRIK